MNKSMRMKFLTVMVMAGFVLVTVKVNIAPASTNIIGIIASDTTFTKAHSPYDLKGPVAVNHGTTLTVELGATVNLNGYYIQVNGTLVARGTDNDKLYFNQGSIIFTSVSTS